MPPQSKLFRIVAYLVLGAYALTNICVVHATENAFWESRRAAVKERRGTLYASLSTVQNPAALAQFVPKTSPLTSPLASAPSLISSEHPLRWLSPLVTPYGTVREVHLSRTPHAPLVIHIQDVHGYLDAQENMAKMIQNVAEASPLTVVGVEGAEGAFKIDDFRRYPNREIQTNVAHFFLKKDLIGAAEYAALTSTKPLTLWGVEDMTLYRQNVSAVKASLAARTQAQKLVTDIHIVLTDRKKNIYSKELNAYDHFTTTYEKNQIGLGDYVKKLLSLRGTSSVSPQIQIFLTALHEEASLDFKAVERDRLRLIDRLVEILDKPALDGLVQTSLNYRSGQLTHGDYHRALDSILKQHNMEWSSFPTLKRYIAYVGLADTINRDNLLKELRQLEDSTQNFLAQTPEQKELMNLTNDTQLLARLTNNQMSPDDWQSYSARRKETHRLATRLPITPSVNFPSDFPTFLKPFEDFCSLALARNDAFAQTLLAKMKETKSHSAVLVAGGFHTEGLLKNLKTQGASYVVLTPKIEKIDSAKNYLDVFAHDPLPLEKLFTGEPIALLTERALATDSPLAKQMHAADLAAHLSTENKAFQTQGLPATKILDALSVFLTGLQTLVGARLAALKPKIIYVSPKDGVTFTILVQGMIHWMRANTDGSVTSTSSTPQISNRAHRLYVKVGDWLFSLIRNLIPEQKMTTPEGIILSVGEPKPISNVVAIQRLAPEIMLYLNGREKIGAFLNLREYLWATLNGNPKELDLAVKSIKSNITTALWTGKLYNASHLIEILGYLTSDPNSEEFLTKLNGQSTAGLENSRLLLNITSALVWMESNRSLMSQMAKPNSMFYGPFIAVKDKDFKLKGLSNSGQKWIWLGHKSKKVKFETNLALDKEGNVLIVHRKELIPHSPPIASKKQLVNHLRSVSRPEKEGLGVGEDRLIFTQSIINDFVAYRWLQILDLGVMNVELTVEPAGDMTIVRSFSVANGQTKNLHSLRQEFEALLNVASFPTGNEVRMLHIPYNGASGFAFDVNSFYDPRNENTNKGTIPALYNGRFISKWADRINDPMALDRLLVMRMNSVPREVMQAIIEEAYATVYGEINLWRHSTEIKVYLENWDTMRKCLAEKYLIPPFPQDQASSSPPVVHYEGMKLINGGATQVAGQEVTPESLNDIKVAVKQNAKELTIPTSTGAKSVHVANEILQEHQSFGYQSQPDFEGALKKYLTEQFHHSPPLTDEIVIAMLNQSSHLFEDHQGNGYIGVNKQILDLNSTRLARNIFWMGLGHELAHESQGALEGKSLRDFEETQEKKDRRAFWQFQRSPTNEERQSLATIITPGTFKLISHFNSETQPVYQFATTPLLDPTTQVPINSEGLEKYFVAPGTTANRVSRFLRENDNSSYRELTLKDPENPEVQVVIRKVYLGPKSTHVSYAVDKANIYNLVNLFGLKRVEDFSAKAPGPSDVVITKNGVERMGLPTRKAVALSHKLNSAFGPLTTARQGQKSNPFMSNGQKIVGEAKMIAGVPVWTVTREDWETINSTPQKEMGASGLFYRLGIHSPRLIALVEDTVVALFTIWGLTYFDFTLSGDSLSALIFGIVDVSFTLGSLAFVGLFLLHFFTGVVQPGGKVFKVNFAEILIRRKAYYVLQLIYHKRLSARATRTASASLLMIPFFAVAFFLNAPSFVVLGFVLAAAMHNYRDGAIEREALAGSLFGGGMQNAGRRLSDTNLTSTQSVPQVQPVQLIREEKPDLTDLFQALSDLKELDFSPTLHEYAVIMQSPEHVDDFLNFLEQLSLETRPTKLGNFMLAPYLTPHSDSDIRKSVKLAKTDENFRRFLARWALIELMLVSEGRQDLSPPHPLLRLAYTIEHFIIELSGDQVDTSSRLKRAAQMAAILRAAGSSISDPSHKGNRDEDIKGDHLLLMSAWGIAGNPQSAGTPFYETYNEILRTAASTTIWNDIINPPSHQKNQKAIYFNIDTLLKQEGSVAGQKAAKSIAMILENQREAENIRLILVYTLRPGGLTNQDLLTRFNAIMFKEYGIQTRNISVDDLLSVNNASGLVVPTTRHLRLSTIQAHATQLKSSTIELWTHAPEKIEKETNVEIRIVDFNRLDKFIEERLKRILFFSIQA